MVILQIFNRYQFPGGEEASVIRVAETLAQEHRVVRCYFDSRDWTRENDSWASIRQAVATVYNPSAIRRVFRLIETEKPDVILLHNVFPICSVGLMWKLVRQPIPVVQYIHNFRPFSVNGYCWADGKLCESGLHLNFLPEILGASWQSSVIKTAWYAGILWLLHLTGCYKRISAWFAISEFMKEKFVHAGVPAEHITVLRHSWNAIPDERYQIQERTRTFSRKQLLFLGRLTEEKGIRVLIDAWEEVITRIPDATLLVAGEGPMEGCVEVKSSKIPSLRYLGSVSGAEKEQLLNECTAVVVPSIWWEPLGIVVYEAYDHGKPVIAASSGGLTETVIDGETGLRHPPGDAAKLAECMISLLEDPDRAAKLGANGRAFLLEQTNPANWESAINRAFKSLLDQHRPDHQADATDPAPMGLAGRGVRTGDPPLRIRSYLADQNPKLGRSLGISRMTEVTLHALALRDDIELTGISSRSSMQGPPETSDSVVFPWTTRPMPLRVLTDHLHPVLEKLHPSPDLWYFPKGFLPLLSHFSRPSVVTIHDTIIQYDEDHYPEWRRDSEYTYWAMMLRHTLRWADAILTVSESSKKQIQAFMQRHEIPEKAITVTYEPCVYETIEQPVNPPKEHFVIHLASCEPHKRTAHLLRWWHDAETQGRQLPMLHLIGTVPPEVRHVVTGSQHIIKRPFLEDSELQAAYRAARALILPSEIEGFGLPALEAYYLGTPVCFVKGTSVEEILSAATDKGGFSLESADSLFAALDEVMAMEPDEIRNCGLKLRETYAAEKVAERMVDAFRGVAAG